MNGSEAIHPGIGIEFPAGDYDGIQFRLGVPAKLNHADPLLAESPLNLSAMHWHWRTGYKFLRAGITTSDDGFWMHLGSTRCSGTIGNFSGCTSPNIPAVKLTNFQPGRDKIVFDMQQLTQDIDLQDNVTSDCSSGIDETECVGPFRMLGLDFDSGETVAHALAITAETAH